MQENKTLQILLKQTKSNCPVKQDFWLWLGWMAELISPRTGDLNKNKHGMLINAELYVIGCSVRAINKVFVHMSILTKLKVSQVFIRSSIRYCSSTTTLARLGLRCLAQSSQCTTYNFLLPLSLVTNSRSNTSTFKQKQIIHGV